MRKPGALETLLTIRNPRHPQPRLVQVLLGNPRQQHGAGARVDVDRDAERLRHTVCSDVVVGRADAAGGEDVGVTMAQCVERGDDLLLDIGNHPDLPHVDADIGQILGDIADVLVLGAPGQDFIADHQNGGGNDLGLCAAHVVHRASPALIGVEP
jgi:hypothetical protein